MSSNTPRSLAAPRARPRRRWFAGAFALIVASLPPRPGETYRFFQRLGDWDEVTSSAGASVWEARDLPLRFRLLENANLPDHEGLDAEVWREINRGSIAAWVDVPTAAVGIVLESEAVPADQASDTDGINTIGFSSYEGFVDGWFSGFARSVWAGREEGWVRHRSYPVLLRTHSGGRTGRRAAVGS